MSEDNNIEEGLVDTGAKVLGGVFKAAKSKIAGGPKMQVTTPAGKTFNMPRGATSTAVAPETAAKGSGLKPVGVGTAVAAGTGVGAGVYGYQKAKEYANEPAPAAKTPSSSAETPTKLPDIDVKAAPKSTAKPMSFSQAFKSAREKATAAGNPSTGQFDYQGKKYQTNVAGEKYVPAAQQTSVEPKTDNVPLPPTRPKDLTPKTETESGKKAKKMSEEINPLIASFLDLQAKNPSNMFEAAKKAKKDHDRDGKIESEKDEVWGSRFRAAKAAGKMEEAALDPKDSDVTAASKAVTKAKPAEDPSTPKSYPGAASTVKGPNPTSAVMSRIAKEEVELDEISSKLASKASDAAYNKYSEYLNKSKPVADEHRRQHLKFHGYAKKADEKERTKAVLNTVSDAKKRRLGIKEEEQVEEINFSQAEIDHINSFFLEASVAPTRPEVATGADSTSDKMSQNDVTGTAESGKKIRKEEVEQIEEGRPKKNPTPESTERDPRKHIQVEAGRAAAGNVVDFTHNDGSKSKITPAMGRKITSHLQGLKPADRQAAVNKMHDCAEGLKV